MEGLFQLPLALVRERSTEYTLQTRPRDQTQLRQEMEQQLYEQLMTLLEGYGTAEALHYSCSCDGDTVVVCLRARCSENIVEERPRIQEENQ